jgi:DNA-binding transcriptional MerR regulator
MRTRLLKVGELAKAVGKTVRAMHLYEELGLLKPASRSEGGYRLYGDDAVARCRWIAKLQDMGFSLTDVQGFVRQWEDARSGPDGMNRVRSVFEQKLEETRETITRMQALEKDLSASLAYLESCNVCAPSRVQHDCACCNEQGHHPATQPDLVAGLALPERAGTEGFVPISNLTEGTR